MGTKDPLLPGFEPVSPILSLFGLETAGADGDLGALLAGANHLGYAGTMATTTDSAAASGRVRPAGSGIALAGDRTLSRRRAFRHSLIVKALKVLLPLTGLAVVAAYSLAIMKTVGWGNAIIALELPTIIPDNIPMVNPHYNGYTKDGGQYWFTSKTAHQDLKNMANVTLNGITGEMIDAQKSKTHMVAARGLFNNKTNILELYDSIDVDADNGLKSHLTRATVHTKENIITSDEPVVVIMDAGTVNANHMTARQKTKEYTFVDKVRTFLKARTPAPSATDPETGLANAEKARQSFGNSSEPIDIVSQRLDVNELQKTALFTGNVKAVQATSSLSSPEMLVTYEGSAVGAGDQAGANTAAQQGGGKVKRVVAKNPVVLTQADGQTVTSRAADFDAQAQTAVLEGDVIMVQIPDKRATGDKAEVDQAADTVLLTGNVLVVQGENQMKGRRLFYSRRANTMQLTSPGPGAGRVASHFKQNGAPGAPQKAHAADGAAQGFAMGNSFKTDPKAPVDIDSDRVDIDDTQKQAVFTGDVRAVQGEFVIRSAELIAHYSGSAGLGGEPAQSGGKPQEAAHLTRLQARKNVIVTSKDGQNATGDAADFDTKANMVTLTGNVVMNQAKNVVRGTKLVIDMTTGESVIRTEPTSVSASAPMTSNTSVPTDPAAAVLKSGRPSAVFYPNLIKGGAAPAAKTGAKAAPAGWSPQTAPPP